MKECLEGRDVHQQESPDWHCLAKLLWTWQQWLHVTERLWVDIYHESTNPLKLEVHVLMELWSIHAHEPLFDHCEWGNASITTTLSNAIFASREYIAWAERVGLRNGASRKGITGLNMETKDGSSVSRHCLQKQLGKPPVEALVTSNWADSASPSTRAAKSSRVRSECWEKLAQHHEAWAICIGCGMVLQIPR